MAKSELETRVCKTCEVEKPIQDFPFTEGGYRRRVCAECYRASRRTSFHVPRYVRRLSELQGNAPKPRAREKVRVLSNQELADRLHECRETGRVPPAYLIHEITRRRLKTA